MNILLGTVTLSQPTTIVSEWVTVAGVLYRQVSMTWQHPSPAEASNILSSANAPTGTSISYLSPLTNANVSYSVKLYAAAIGVLRETGGNLTYDSLSLTMREVISP